MQDLLAFFKMTESYLKNLVKQVSLKMKEELKKFYNQIQNDLVNLKEFFKSLKSGQKEFKESFERLKIEIKVKIEDLQKVKEYAKSLSFGSSITELVTQKYKQRQHEIEQNHVNQYEHETESENQSEDELQGAQLFEQEVQEFNQVISNICKECMGCFGSIEDLKNHKKLDHKDMKLNYDSMESEDNPIQNKIDKIYPLYTCTTCQMLVSSTRSYRRHLSTYHKMREWYVCPQCRSIYVSQPQLAKHIFQDHTKSLGGSKYYVCPFTEEVFKASVILQGHITHTFQYHKELPDNLKQKQQ